MTQILMTILSLPVASHSWRWIYFIYPFIKSEQLSKIVTSVLFWTKRFLHTWACQLQLSHFEGLTSSFRGYLPSPGFFPRNVMCSVGQAEHLPSQLWETQWMVFSAIWQLSGTKQSCFECGAAKHYSNSAKHILQEELKGTTMKAALPDALASRDEFGHSTTCLVLLWRAPHPRHSEQLNVTRMKR